MGSNFYTDAIKADPRFGSSQRISDLALLEPITRAAVVAIVADAKVMGIDLMVFETFRSQARQQLLFNQHATQLRTVGVHKFGLACDIVKDIGGDPSWKGDFTFLGRLASQYNLVWGGNWNLPGPHRFVDSCHVQRCAVSRETLLFHGVWYPDDNYDPIG